MLYLTRKIGQSIMINDSIEVSVVEIQGKTVKLGFKYPSSEKILRREIYDKICKENQLALESTLAVHSLLLDKKND